MLKFLDCHLSNMASMTDYRMGSPQKKNGDWQRHLLPSFHPPRCTISTINMAHTVIMTKQKRNDHANAFLGPSQVEWAHISHVVKCSAGWFLVSSDTVITKSQHKAMKHGLHCFFHGKLLDFQPGYGSKC